MPNTGALFVAVPSAADEINTISKEDQAHITLTFFGDAANLPADLVEDLRQAADIAASEIGSFTASVSGTAVLGEDKANVLLIESAELVQLYKWLQAHPAVEMAEKFNENRFPWWIPHLTLTYGDDQPTQVPDKISFDRLGLWLGESREYHGLVGNVYTPMSAAAACMPVIACAKDLSLGIRFGNQVPDARWYVMKRAQALGCADRIPAQWSQT